MAMHRNKSVSNHQFAMVPRADIPRASFQMQKTYKTTFDSGYLVPFFLQEVLPGDTFNLKATLFARLATPIVPIMDNMYLETFFFFVPNRLVWNRWVSFMGEQDNPGDSIAYTIPQVVSAAGGFVVGQLGDFFGLPTVGQVGGGNTISVSVLPFRCYNLVWNQWFRDENIQNSAIRNVGDGPDNISDYALLRRGKRHDYFTSALPFVQKGTSVTLPLGTSAPVKTSSGNQVTGAQNAMTMLTVTGAAAPVLGTLGVINDATNRVGAGATGTGAIATNALLYPSNLYADLSVATAATINQIRQAFQIQKLLERDARGGTRYTEIVRSHFGVASPDARLQRSEYLGGGSTPININPVAQTSASAVTGSTTPIGKLAAFGTALAGGHGFTQSFVEHGHVIGLVNVRADLTYQQGMHRMWSRSTRFDFYFPVFAALGEQAILNKEIYCDGSANDANAFGYQERWAEYRYNPSQITGSFRSTSAGTLDFWHLSQKFTALPTLNTTFIQDTPPVSRVIAVPSEPQFLLDAFFDIRAARPMPLYSVPGLVDHF